MILSPKKDCPKCHGTGYVMFNKCECNERTNANRSGNTPTEKTIKTENNSSPAERTGSNEAKRG